MRPRRPHIPWGRFARAKSCRSSSAAPNTSGWRTPRVRGVGHTGTTSGTSRPPPSRSLGTSLALDPVGTDCRGLVRGGNAGPPMKGQLPVGRPFGVPVALHFSWFVIAALILLSLVQRFHEAHADWTPPLVWGTAAVTAALFFVALVLHELSHAVVA